jgi:hypothetical protein
MATFFPSSRHGLVAAFLPAFLTMQGINADIRVMADR